MLRIENVLLYLAIKDSDQTFAVDFIKSHNVDLIDGVILVSTIEKVASDTGFSQGSKTAVTLPLRQASYLNAVLCASSTIVERIFNNL